eukprot:668624-Amphidinium_carterae.1
MKHEVALRYATRRDTATFIHRRSVSRHIRDAVTDPTKGRRSCAEQLLRQFVHGLFEQLAEEQNEIESW